MNSNPKHNSTLDSVLSLVLRTGLALSIITCLFGGISFLLKQSHDKVDYKVFTGEPTNLKGIFAILNGVGEDKTLAIIQLGIIFLIATPICRVISCGIIFASEKDFLYVSISMFVLIVLLFCFFI